MLFSQTRSNADSQATFGEVILHPKASFGGLFTLHDFPTISLSKLASLGYTELCEAVFSHLGLEAAGLLEALQSYANFDDPNNPAPVRHLCDKLYLQELYHGPSRAFKDMALQPLGKLFSHLAKQDSYLILTATSGDTGPATLESFKGLKNIFVLCLYPSGGTSDVQRLQMNTQEASNLKVLPILGNFDDAQRVLKALLNDEDFTQTLLRHSLHLSAANSVNFGRIAFQIIYHIWGYLSLVRKGVIAMGEEILSVIPSGNFGNALGAFYAKKMGVPFEKIVIASNPNNILTDFIQSGIYDISHRHLLQTYSPAMDILKSSNVERVLFALFGAERTRVLMEDLDAYQRYVLTQKELEQLQSDFDAGDCNDIECLESIKSLAQMGEIIDPHTANAYFVAQRFRKPCLICSTAEWSKFSPTIVYALTGERKKDEDAIAYLQEHFDLKLSPKIAELFLKPEINQAPLKPEQVKNFVLDWVRGLH